MGSVAIITARGGSKRIPKKNIKEFCGKPVIAYSIAAALGSGIFDEVMVSTDSGEIADIARKYGAEVPFMRSSEASNDYATTADVVTEVLHDYGKAGKHFDWFACIYPTAPFVTGGKLRDAAGLLGWADSVISVAKYSYPPQRAFVVRDGGIAYQHPEFERARSQDLEPVYHDCGQFYFCRAGAFLAGGSLVAGRAAPFIVPEEEAQDIDTMEDWDLAELKYAYLKRAGRL